MDVDVELLIDAVCNRPALWDKTFDAYKDRIEIAKSWREVAEILHSDFSSLSTVQQKKYEKEITTKWKTVRDGYRKASDRAKKAARSGTPSSKIKKYVYHNQMDFLRKVFDSRATDDTLECDASDEESSHGGVKYEFENAVTTNQENIATQETPVTSKKKGGRHQMPNDEFEERLLRLLENPNRHICFVQGLLPTLETFSDDEVIQFQVGTLMLIQQIKSARIPSPGAVPTLGNASHILHPGYRSQPAYSSPSQYAVATLGNGSHTSSNSPPSSCATPLPQDTEADEQLYKSNLKQEF